MNIKRLLCKVFSGNIKTQKRCLLFCEDHASVAVFCRLFMSRAQITKFDVMPSNSSHDQYHLFLTGACLIGYKCLPFKLLMLHLWHHQKHLVLDKFVLSKPSKIFDIASPRDSNTEALGSILFRDICFNHSNIFMFQQINILGRSQLKHLTFKRKIMPQKIQKR